MSRPTRFRSAEAVPARAGLRVHRPGDADSETHHYLDTDEHGHALVDLQIRAECANLIETIREACDGHPELNQMSAMKTRCWPIMLLACRHWPGPMPPHVYITAMAPAAKAQDPD